MLTMAVLSIVITAPLGAILILALGPLLLTNDVEEVEKIDPESGEGDQAEDHH